MRGQIVLCRVQRVLQPLVGSVGDRWVYDQHHAGLDTSPQASISVLAVHYLARRSHHALLVMLGLGLLSGRHDRDGDREYLCQRTRDSSQRKLCGCVWRLSRARDSGQVHIPHDAVPVEICKIRAGYSQKSASKSIVQTCEAFVRKDELDGVQRAFVVRGVTGRMLGIGRVSFDLDLELGFDDVQGVDKSVGKDRASAAGDGETPRWDFVLCSHPDISL
nr:hypothetical protein CFP56_63751 [Quercus suber]